ncbi:MAG: MalY/PatB family protein [Desulfuromonadaceae bacterium]
MPYKGEQLDFDRITERRNSGSAKWDDADALFGAEDVLPMWVADMDFTAPQPVLDALHERIDHGVFGYPGSRRDAMNASVTGWLARRHGWNVEPEWLATTSGVVSGIHLAVQSFTEPGDEVIIQTPVYHPFFDCIRNHGRILVENPLVLADGRYRFDLGDLEKKARSAKLLILCSPHNPVGRVWTRVELEAVAAIVKRHDLLVVSDEIHGDLLFPPHRLIPFGTLSNISPEKVVTFVAPSKTFNLAGLAASIAIIPDPVLRRRFVDNQKTLGVGKSNFLGLVALEAAYRLGEPWLESLLLYLEGNARHLVEYARNKWPQIDVDVPEGTYLAWLDCRRLGLTEEELHRLFFEFARVGLNRGSQFGSQGRGFMRLNFATPRATLNEGLERITRALKERV